MSPMVLVLIVILIVVMLGGGYGYPSGNNALAGGWRVGRAGLDNPPRFVPDWPNLTDLIQDCEAWASTQSRQDELIRKQARAVTAPHHEPSCVLVTARLGKHLNREG